MQVVYILCNDCDVIVAFHFSQQLVPPVRLRLYQLLAQAVVEVRDQFRVFLPAFGSSHLFDGILLPQSARIAKSAESTLRTHASSCQYDQFLHSHSLIDEYAQS